MTDELNRASSAPISADPVQRLIDEQLRVMEKQLSLMKALAATAAQPADMTTPGSPPPTNHYPKRVPLTDVQRDVWITCQLSSEGSAAYNLSTLLRLQGDLNVGVLEESLRRLVLRHESLRTTFDASGDYQLVSRTAEPSLGLVNLSHSPEPERAAQFEAFLDADMSTPYDLVNGPLFRPGLVRLAGDDHVLVISTHHLISDGWSLGVMKRELAAIYSSIIAGDRDGLPDVVQFSEYVAWRDDQRAAAEPYWLDLFAERPAQLEFSVDKARPPVRSFEFESERTIIDEALMASLKRLATQQGVSMFTVLLAAWEILLHRLSGQTEFVSGVFVSGQASIGARDLVGLCADLLPLRVRVAPDERLSDYLARVNRSTYDALDHQGYTVGQLASSLQLARDVSRPVLASTVITLQTAVQDVAFGGLRVTPSSHGRRSFGLFDLEAYLKESATGIVVDFQYSSALFEASTIQRWLRHYVRLLRQLEDRPAEPVAKLGLLDDSERHELLTRWNDTSWPTPDRPSVARIEAQVARHPNREAVRSSGGSLTYGQLNGRANQLARYLRSVGVAAERLVGIHLDRSPDVLVAMLAIHKAGGAFVPLDPMFPPERLTTIARDAGVHVLLTHGGLAHPIRLEGVEVVVLDGSERPWVKLDDSDLAVDVALSDLAYVISTSGSTGKPKGVEVTQLSLANQLDAMERQPGLTADDVLLAVTTMSFDPSLLELFLPLMVGATVVLADAQEAVDAVWLREHLSTDQITVMQATPATWQMLLDAGWTGTPGLKALCGGEALTREQAAAICSRVESLWNVYGTTETTVWSSSSKVDPAAGRIPLGPPIANTEFHVLGPRMELQPPGVVGELHIGGVGLARGYRGLPELTEERFVMHAFDGGRPRRLYKTGDLARRFASGDIEFLGRDDFQVKIRGFRIELGEIETTLARHPGVRECAVIARARTDGAKRLIAYVVPGEGPPADVSALRMHLRRSLPEYMVPSQFVTLDGLPLSTNRKVDRARLPDPDNQRPDLSTEFVPPRTEYEVMLARIWQKLLDVEEVGTEDNFFELGGDSLMALRCMIEANRSGMSLAPNSIFRYQTVSELAVAAVEGSATDGADQEVVLGELPLTPAQIRYLTERDTPDAHHWNLSGLVQAEHLSARALRTAVEALLRHHDALRLRLWRDDGRWRQEITAPQGEIPFESHDISRWSAAEQVEFVERTCIALQGSFDLQRGPLIRVAHFDCGPDAPDRLFVTIHHFAVDALTWTVFWEDLEQAYGQAASGAAVALPPKTTSIKTWAAQLQRLAETPRIADTAEEWLGKPWHEVARLPLDFEPVPRSNTNVSTAVVELELDTADTRALLGGLERPDHLVIGGLACCLSQWTSSPTVLIDVLGHGRDAVLEGVNLSRTVGFTLSYNPLVLSHPTWAPTPATVEAVTQQIGAGPEGFSFELLRFLSPDAVLRERLNELPRAEVLFNYRGASGGKRADAMWATAAEATGPSDSPRGLRQYPLAIRAALVPNLRLTFVYSTRLHTQATIEARVVEVEAAMRGLAGQSLVRV